MKKSGSFDFAKHWLVGSGKTKCFVCA